MKEWGVSVLQAKYSHDGHWYSLFTRFPAALVDANGYLLFETEKQFRESPYLALGKQVSVKVPGISGVPGYVQKKTTSAPIAEDVDVHEEGASEGLSRLQAHLVRERRRGLSLRKKRSVESLSCEACEFSFSATYGAVAAEYCEVHHLLPLATSGESRRTLLKDLAILCANCHRVVHLRNPPLTLLELKAMLRQHGDA